ncbi:ornithine utilization transcriptional regulator OruR [soil metagenome]
MYTVAAPLARIVLARAVTADLDLAKLARLVGIDPKTLDDPDGRVPAEGMVRIWDEVATLTGDPNLGLNVGRELGGAGATLAGHLVRASRTVGEGLERVLLFYRVLNDVHPPRYVIDDAEASFSVRTKGTSLRVPRHGMEFAFAWLTCLSRKASGRELRPLRVRFEHSAPKDTRALEAVLGKNLRFDQDENEIVMARSDWATPTLGPDADLLAMLEHTAKKLLERLPTAPSIEGRVREALVLLLPRGDANVEAVASALELQPRTLQRYLADEKTTFAEIFETTRRHLAEAHLGDGVHSIAEIALLVGFSDQSAFHKAFARWTGKTPGDYRKTRRG